MGDATFEQRLSHLIYEHKKLLDRENLLDEFWYNGVYERYQYPVLTRDHTPLSWRYDLNSEGNPFLMERLGIGAVRAAGAIVHDDKVCLVVQLEGTDGHCFFGVAESETGIDGFRFRDLPIAIPQDRQQNVAVSHLQVTRHEDGWVYGFFFEKPRTPEPGPRKFYISSERCVVVRSRDLEGWQRLEDLEFEPRRPRSVILHPAFVERKYGFYTWSHDDLTCVCRNGELRWACCAEMPRVVIRDECPMTDSQGLALVRAKTRAGCPPVRTDLGWLHVSPQVHATGNVSRCVLNAFLCDRDHPERVLHRPGGFFLEPPDLAGRTLACSGLVVRPGGQMLIYFTADNAQIHVLTTTVEKMLDYVTHTPADEPRAREAFDRRTALIRENLQTMQAQHDLRVRRVDQLV